jgi:glutamate-1-semialdehyde 2,1-aminomutase
MVELAELLTSVVPFADWVMFGKNGNDATAVRVDAPAVIGRAGARFKEGLEAQGRATGFLLAITGPVQMPHLSFENDPDLKRVFVFADAAIRRGVLLHPWHNMFVSCAHTDEVIDEALERTEQAFTELTNLED